MSYLLNNQQKFNELVFEHRNKNYGAYAIRSAYGATLFKSLLLIGLMSAVFASIAFYLSKKRSDDNVAVNTGCIIPDVITFTTVCNIKPDAPTAPAEKKKVFPPDPGKASTATLGTTINDTLETQTPPEKMNNTPSPLSSTVVGTENNPNSPSENGQPGISENGSGSGGIASPGGGSAKIHEGPDIDTAPEFDGGLAALYRFISTHLKYPSLASDEGKEGTVYVRFVVDERGRVGNLMLRNNLGYGLDDEAKRVVSLIPDFKTPAKINKQPVKVYYEIPIKFKLH